MNFLLIGAGSSAGRFIKILLDKGHSVGIYRHKLGLKAPEGCALIESLDDLSMFDGGIISSPTASHLRYCKMCIEQKLPTLVEKPFSHSMAGIEDVVKKARRLRVPLVIGCNLRFLPVIQKIKKYLDQKKLGQILHADLYVGQYLPTWRPWLDYRDNYSASYQRGGGVALDLIHEIDLALHFFPGIQLRPVICEKLSDLEIDTEDFVQLQTKLKPFIQVHLDYLHHIKTRQYRIVGSSGAINCDIINKKFEFHSSKGKSEVITDPLFFDVGQTFTAEIEDFIRIIKSKKPIAITDRSLALDALKVAIAARRHVQT